MLNVEERGDVTVVRIEHGRVGAMDAELLDALTEAVRACDGALVLTATGSAFSAGVDLRRILDGGRPCTEAFLASLSRVFRAVFDHPRPTVAAVNGHAIAGGCVLALACDVRLTSGGRIGLAELAAGCRSRPRRWRSCGTRWAGTPTAPACGRRRSRPSRRSPWAWCTRWSTEPSSSRGRSTSPRSWPPVHRRPTVWRRPSCTVPRTPRSRRPRPRTMPPCSPAGPPRHARRIEAALEALTRR